MFAKSWSERTGAVTCERMAQRVFTLHRLIPPTGVPGVVRRAGSRDIELLHGFRPIYDAAKIAFMPIT